MAAAAGSALAKHWVYVDLQRTHEVHAQVALQPGGHILTTTEFPAGAPEPADVVQTRSAVSGEPELLALLNELEQRLTGTGAYARADVADMRWTPLPAAAAPLDLRGHETPLPGAEGGKLRFHHFHAASTRRDRLLISMPRPGLAGRHVLAEVAFEHPRADPADIQVIHSRLAAPLLASVVAREHVEAPRRGFRKLFEPKDYERAFGDGWLDRTRSLFSRAAARFVDASAVAAAPAAPSGPRIAPATIQGALASSRVEALKTRFIDPVQEALLVERGEHAIRRYVNSLRRGGGHHVLYELSILEAALLLQYAIPAGMADMIHDEGGKLLRYVGGAR